MPGGRAAAAAGAREGGAFASAVPTVLDPSLAERGRLLRAAVATIVQALGEQGVTYRRHLHKWMEGLDPSDVKRVLRNRAGDLNSRRKRINRLSRDLSPFDLSAKRAAAAAHNGGNSIGMGGGEGGPAHGSSMPPLVPGTIAMKKAKSFAGENGLPTSSRPTSPTGTDVASSVASMTSSVCSAMQNCEVDDRPQRLRRHQPEGGAESADAPRPTRRAPH